MSKLPAANLPPAAMPWAREIEKRLGETDRKAGVAYTNVGAFGQTIAAVNQQTVVQQVDLTENTEALRDLNLFKLPELDANLAELDTALNDPETGINAQMAAFDVNLEDLTGQVAAHTVDLSGLEQAQEDLDLAMDQLDADFNTPVTGVKAVVAAAKVELDNLTKPGGTLDQLDQALTADLTQLDNQLNDPTTGLNKRLLDTNSDLSGLNNIINNPTTGLSKKLNDANAALNSMNTQLNDPATGLSKKLTDAQADLIQLNKPGGTLALMEQATQGLSEDLDNLDSTLATAQNTISAHTTSLSGLGTRLTAAEGEVVAAQQAVSNLNSSTLPGLTAALAGKLSDIPNAIKSTHITDDAVTAAKIITNAVTADAIAANSIYAASIQSEAVVAGKIATDAVTANTIKADAVTADKIKAGAVSAEKIEAGSITGDRIAANTIAAEQLLIGDFTNHFNDPTFSHPTGYAGWTRVLDALGDPGLEKFGTAAQNGTYQTFTEFPVQAGEQFLVSGKRTNLTGAGHGTTTTGDAVIFLQRLTGGTWTYWTQGVVMSDAGVTTSNPLTIPADTTKVRLGFFTQGNMPATTKVRVSDVQVRRLTGATLIEDGAITTDKIATNAIDARTIKAGEIKTEAMAANSIHGDRITGGTIAANKIVANSITTTQITAGAVNGDRITANTLNADRIVAGSITTDRMTANSISGDRIAANTLNADRIVAGSITTDRMTANSISGDRIAANTLNADRIVANSITAGQIKSNEITATQMKTGTITAASAILANGVITTAKIQDGAIINAKIEDATIEAAKIKTINADTIVAGTIGADRIGANTISASKLVVGSPQNLIPETVDLAISRAGFPTDPWGFNSSDPSVWLLGSKNAQSETFSLRAGDRVRVSAEVRGVGTVYFGVQKLGTFSSSVGQAWAVGPQALTSAFQPFSGEIVITESRNDYAFTALAQYAAGSSSGHTWFRNPKVQLMDDGELIVDGAIKANKIAAKAIGTEKLLVGDFQNMFADVTAETEGVFPHLAGSAATSFYSTARIAARGGIDPGRHLYSVVSAGTNQYAVEWGGTNGKTIIPVEPNTEYYTSVLASAYAGSNQIGWVVREYNATGAATVFRGYGAWQTINATSWTTVGESFLTRSDTTHVQVYTRANSAGGIRMALPSMRRKNAGELIVDGAITADKILARTITSTKIATGAITANEIFGKTITAAEIQASSLTSASGVFGVISANDIKAGTLTGRAINGGVITGATVQSATSGKRTIMNASGLEFAEGSTQFGGSMYMRPGDYGISITGFGSDVSMGIGTASGGTDWDGYGVMTVTRPGSYDAIVATDIVTARRFVQGGEPIAYRQAAGIQAIPGTTLASGASVNATVPLPSGRFTVPPVVTASATQSSVICTIAARSATSITINCYNPHSVALNISNAQIHWQATQMLTNSAQG